jgi:pimeloyl-ACP methyl ester carboxylesterase
MMAMGAVESEATIRRKTLWVVQDGGSGANCFALVLAGYGDAWAARELGRGMGSQQTLLALQPPDDDSFDEFATLPRLAALYVQHLRARQPSGPYSLGGYSAGALIALEMARQLQAQAGSGAVASLFMFDPLFVRYTWLEQMSYGAMERAIALAKPLLRSTRAWKIMAAMVQDRGLQRHLHVLRGEIPGPYSGSITLVEAWGSRFVRPPTFMPELRRVAAGGLQRWRQAATHHAFMRPPHVHTLGQEIGLRITAAQAIER